MSTAQEACGVKEPLRERLHREVVPALEALIERLPAELVSLEEAEKVIREGVLQAGRQLLQAWSEFADRRVARPGCGDCGRPMRHKGYKSCVLVTTLGTLRFRRPRWRCVVCGKDCYPHDETLRFGRHGVSWPLAEVVARLGAQLPFGQARENLEEDYRVHLSRQTVQQVSEEAGAMVIDREDRHRQQIEQLPVRQRGAAMSQNEESPEKVAVCADGAMIHAEGEWREIRVASVAAFDGESEVTHRRTQARFLSVDEFGWHLSLLAASCGYFTARLRCFVADGAHWLWEMAATQFPEAVQILDWYHLSQHIHEAAVALFGQGTDEGDRWADERLAELWEGQAGKTLGQLKDQHKRCRSPDKRETLRKLIGYLENNRLRIDYPRYRALGLPCGSGQVEGACKWLVADRCKQAGMRNWTRRGAEGVLRMRAALQDGTYHPLWNRRLRPAA